MRLICIIFSSIILSRTLLGSTETCLSGKQHFRAAARHIEKGGIGYDQGYTTLEAFFAPDPNRWSITPFLDARGHIFNNGKWATNLGAGVRSLWGERVYGVNGYYDYRNTGRFHTNQVGVGLETLGKRVDFRVNGYFPVGKRVSHPYETAFKTFDGHNLILSQKFQSAMRGGDSEVGLHFGGSKSFDFYTAVGPYYFKGKYTPSTWGVKARVGGSYREFLKLEFSDSYDRTFHNKFQTQISFIFSFGPKSCHQSRGANVLNDRMLQPVGRQEIIVIDKIRKQTTAIDPTTRRPYFFVFVDNTSQSNGTYESPYHSLVQAQDNSSTNDIIYVFPGDRTTTGMDLGILLKPNQRLWGSGVGHWLQTSKGAIFIPAQSHTSPTITNTDLETDGNVITLATNNAISGFTITSAINDAIYGVNPQNLEVSSCTIQNSSTYAIETVSADATTVLLTDNQFLNNVNGVFLNLNGTSSVVCANNRFAGQTSVSSFPLEISATGNMFTTRIENNIIDGNTTGAIRFNLDQVVNTDITLVNNGISNNGTGAQASLGSSLTVISNGVIDRCALTLVDNTFSGNSSNVLYLHTSGAFKNLEATIVGNSMSNNGGSATVFATPVDVLKLEIRDNTIIGANDNGIAVIASGSTSVGNIVISNNTIEDIGNASNGITINQDFSSLNLSVVSNDIHRCEGTGFLSYAPGAIDFLTVEIADNTIADCKNLSSNGASAIDMEQFTAFVGTVSNNSLTDNLGSAVLIGSSLSNPTACLRLIGNNSSTDYLIFNPVDGLFNLSPCIVESVNTGLINISGVVNLVQSCSNPEPCSP